MRRRSIAWCAAVLLSIGTLTAAEAAGPLTILASLSLGIRAHDLVLDGDFAYVATDSGLTVVDISNPATPVKLGSVNLGGRAMGIALRGSHAFLAVQGGDLKVVDVSNPNAPVLVASRAIPGSTWDVAIKDDIAYVGTFSGQLYLFSITTPTAPQQIDVLGLPAWVHAGSDATNLAKLNSYVTAGSAKVTGVSVTGNSLFAVDWNYGRLYYYDVTVAANPVFRGTHYAPFLLRVEGDPANDAAYMLAAYGYVSGIYSVTLSTLSPDISTRYTTCTGCDYFQSPVTDNGGLTLAAHGKYVVYIAGKQGRVQVLDVSDPTDIKDAGWLPIGAHYSRTAESMGVQTRDDYIFTAAGMLGLQVFYYPGLSQ